MLYETEHMKNKLALRVKIDPLQKWFLFANVVALLMQVNKIKKKKSNCHPV